MNLQPYLRALLIALVPACLGGCLDVDQEIELDSEGAIIARLKYAAPESTIKRLQSMVDLTETLHGLGPQTNHPAAGRSTSVLGPQLFDFEYVQKHLESNKGPGLRISALDHNKEESWDSIEIKGAFDDLGHLRKLDHFAGQNMSLTKLENGNYELVIRISEEGDYDIPTLQAGSEEFRTIMSIFSGFRVSVKVRVPGRIVTASTFRKTDRSATWSYDIKRDPNALRELHEPLRVEFMGTGLALQEFPAKPGP
ncbi:MAG: hypothetical protein O2923_02220 [Verrucomicrobia bacterium]|nr:hypothetical protein [Verrucomicrobiota bacterium]MDA1085951.1 hypothetical protein [Verrucomicrobiota bacterium]